MGAWHFVSMVVSAILLLLAMQGVNITFSFSFFINSSWFIRFKRWVKNNIVITFLKIKVKTPNNHTASNLNETYNVHCIYRNCWVLTKHNMKNKLTLTAASPNAKSGGVKLTQALALVIIIKDRIPNTHYNFHWFKDY